MKKAIKVICMVLCLIMLLTLLLGNNSVGTAGQGCTSKKLYNYGDFIITEDNELYDFSEIGAKKDYIIFPYKIKGTYTQIYYQRAGMFGPAVSSICNFTYYENIKKFYQIDAISQLYYDNVRHYKGLGAYYSKTTKETIENNDKTFYVENYNHKFFANINSKYFGNSFAYKNDYIKTYLNEQELVYAYLSKTDYESGKNVFTKKSMLANIQFVYNYQNAPNNGYYWIDDLETGETLNYIPTPTRDGYTFAGWYADSECLIPYDFTIPYEKKDLIFKEGIVNEKECYMLVYPQNYATYIYAKWI